MFPSRPMGTAPDHLIFFPLCQMDFSGIEDISDECTHAQVSDCPLSDQIQSMQLGLSVTLAQTKKVVLTMRGKLINTTMHVTNVKKESLKSD